jgi:hypothetical protein
MIIARRASPLVRTVIDVRIDRADRSVDGRVFDGWGVHVPGTGIF